VAASANLWIEVIFVALRICKNDFVWFGNLVDFIYLRWR